jgi:hypothetical protein
MADENKVKAVDSSSSQTLPSLIPISVPFPVVAPLGNLFAPRPGSSTPRASLRKRTSPSLEDVCAFSRTDPDQESPAQTAKSAPAAQATAQAPKVPIKASAFFDCSRPLKKAEDIAVARLEQLEMLKHEVDDLLSQERRHEESLFLVKKRLAFLETGSPEMKAYVRGGRALLKSGSRSEDPEDQRPNLQGVEKEAEKKQRLEVSASKKLSKSKKRRDKEKTKKEKRATSPPSSGASASAASAKASSPQTGPVATVPLPKV